MKPSSDLMHRSQPRRRAMVLLLVLAYIVLAGGLVAIISASIAQLARSSRHENTAAIMRQLIDSGYDWATAHPNQAIELDGAAVAGPDGSAHVVVTPDATTGRVRVEATLVLNNHTHTRSASFAAGP